jgi:restriction system protein
MELIIIIIVFAFIYWLITSNKKSPHPSQPSSPTKQLSKEQRAQQHIINTLAFSKEKHAELEQKEAKNQAWQLRYGSMQLKEIDKLSGIAFEQFLQGLFQRMGYQVKTTATSGDFGADLVLTKNNERIAIQAKRWQGLVGVGAVQEALSGKSYYHCESAWVVTTSNFTTQAIQLAKKAEVKLINRKELAKLIAQHMQSDTP